ncbi:MAG: PHB depolymerase family esterase [Gemmatimonadota bacterium]|nr:PHB depolymerase family esterase [Gemmatimonadota bacterium]
MPTALPVRHEDRALLVVLHDCAQKVADLAMATRLNDAADHDGFIVIYPEQSAAANALRCWNWYVPEQTGRDRGEAGILAGLIDSVARLYGVSPRRTALVGMSAGAAMAANLAVDYPDRIGALALHSGMPALAATDFTGALAAMRDGTPGAALLGKRALARMGARARAMPVIALQGADDKTVNPVNLVAIVRQWTEVNAHASGQAVPVEQHLFPGVGHAWSGGATGVPFLAPTGPDATSMILTFFRRHGVLMPRGS